MSASNPSSANACEASQALDKSETTSACSLSTRLLFVFNHACEIADNRFEQFRAQLSADYLHVVLQNLENVPPNPPPRFGGYGLNGFALSPPPLLHTTVVPGSSAGVCFLSIVRLMSNIVIIVVRPCAAIKFDVHVCRDPRIWQAAQQRHGELVRSKHRQEPRLAAELGVFLTAQLVCVHVSD